MDIRQIIILFPIMSFSARIELPGDGGSAVHLSQALGASPVAFGNIVEGRDQTEDVIAVITAVTQQQAVLSSPTATYQAHVLVHLSRNSNCEHNIGITVMQANILIQNNILTLLTGGLIILFNTVSS